MRNEHRNCALASMAAVGLLLAVTSSAGAWVFRMRTMTISEGRRVRTICAPVLNLSPKELSRLQNLINDPQPDAAVRDKNVKDTLGLFLEHQLWEKAHPGELWDAPKK